MHRLAAATAIAVAMLSTATLAEDLPPPEHVDVVAAVLMGLVPFGTAQVAGDKATVVQQGAGRFYGSTEQRHNEYAATVTEPQPCQFELSFKMASSSLSLGFDATKLKAITIAAASKEPGAAYTLYKLAFDGPPGMIMAAQGGGDKQAVPNQTTIGTSLTQEQLETYISTLVSACSAS